MWVFDGALMGQTIAPFLFGLESIRLGGVPVWTSLEGKVGASCSCVRAGLGHCAHVSES